MNLDVRMQAASRVQLLIVEERSHVYSVEEHWSRVSNLVKGNHVTKPTTYLGTLDGPHCG